VKVLFVYPAHESLGLECLSAALRRDGVETALAFDPVLFDEPGFVRSPLLARLFDRRAALRARARAFRPDLVAFSVTSDLFGWACRRARELKTELGVPVAFGGIHPTALPAQTLAEDCVDYVVVGEGDAALVELARALREGRTAHGLPGVWTRRDGKAEGGPVRPLIADLDALPDPDKELYLRESPLFRDGYLVAASRGCPMRCAYCCNDVYHKLYGGRTLRYRGPERVLAELERAKAELRPAYVHFTDEVLNADRRWLAEFLPAYRARVGLPFSCYLFPDLVDAEGARALAAAGCFKAQMGVQVFDDEKRRSLLQRPSTRERIAGAIGALKAAGVYVTCDNMLGFPDETEAELAALAAFYAEHAPDHCETFFLRYYPGASLTAWALANGHLAEASARLVERGGIDGGIVRDDRLLKPFARRFLTLLAVLPLLPPRARAALARGHRRVPALPNLPLRVAARLLNRPRWDFHTRRQVLRYLRFLPAFGARGPCESRERRTLL
jgi:radical SAM superfamily enzyme YgiQ (UPF0313 family)